MVYIPGKALLGITRSYYNGEGISRRDLTLGLGEGGAGLLLAAGAALGIGYRNRRLEEARSEQERRHIDALAGRISEHTKIKKDAAIAALSALKRQDAVAIIGANLDKPKYPRTDKEVEESLANPVICSSGSPFMDFVYRQLPPHLQQFIRDNTISVIFADKVVRKLRYMEEDVGGLSLGDGVILVSRDDVLLYPSKTGHEARHENENKAAGKQGKRLRILPSERAAMHTERDILEWQLESLNANQKSPRKSKEEFHAEYVLDGALGGVDERLKTAVYLGSGRFQEAFEDVYPENVILSKELLEAQPPTGFLERLVRDKRIAGELDNELYYASRATATALGKPREYAIRELYDIVNTPNSGEFEIINSIFGLRYLAPHTIELTIHNPFKPRGAHVGIGSKANFKFKNLISDPEYSRMVREEDEFTLRTGWHHLPGPVPQKQFQAYGQMPPVEVFLENRPH